MEDSRSSGPAVITASGPRVLLSVGAAWRRRNDLSIVYQRFQTQGCKSDELNWQEGAYPADALPWGILRLRATEAQRTGFVIWALQPSHSTQRGVFLLSLEARRREASGT